MSNLDVLELGIQVSWETHSQEHERVRNSCTLSHLFEFLRSSLDAALKEQITRVTWQIEPLKISSRVKTTLSSTSQSVSRYLTFDPWYRLVSEKSKDRKNLCSWPEKWCQILHLRDDVFHARYQLQFQRKQWKIKNLYVK